MRLNILQCTIQSVQQKFLVQTVNSVEVEKPCPRGNDELEKCIRISPVHDTPKYKDGAWTKTPVRCPLKSMFQRTNYMLLKDLYI